MQTNEKLILADQLYRGAAELQHIKQANILETLKEKGQQGLDYVKDVGGKGLDYIKEKGQQAGEAIGNYRPFDKGDAAKAALIAALLGGGLGAGFGKLRNMMRPEEEQEENSDSTFYGALGALGAATPLALAPYLAQKGLASYLYGAEGKAKAKDLYMNALASGMLTPGTGNPAEVKPLDMDTMNKLHAIYGGRILPSNPNQLGAGKSGPKTTSIDFRPMVTDSAKAVSLAGLLGGLKNIAQGKTKVKPSSAAKPLTAADYDKMNPGPDDGIVGSIVRGIKSKARDLGRASVEKDQSK